jgi:hypothetical protein
MGPTGFPWEREWESELDGNGMGKGNDSTGMGIGQFPRVATDSGNQGNLEYSGNLINLENSGNSRGICA